MPSDERRSAQKLVLIVQNDCIRSTSNMSSIELHERCAYVGLCALSNETPEERIRYVTANTDREPIDSSQYKLVSSPELVRVYMLSCCAMQWHLYGFGLVCLCCWTRITAKQRKTFKTVWLMAWPQPFTQLHFGAAFTVLPAYKMHRFGYKISTE